MAGRDEEFANNLRHLRGGKILGGDTPPVDPRSIRTRHVTNFVNVGFDVGQHNSSEGVCEYYEFIFDDIVENHEYRFKFKAALDPIKEALARLTPLGEVDPDWVAQQEPTDEPS